MSRSIRLITLILALSVSGCAAILPMDGGNLPLIGHDTGCVDAWSFVHFTSGGLLGENLDSDSFLPTLAILVGWEVAEPYFWPDYSENELNQRCDIVIGLAGWLAATHDD